MMKYIIISITIIMTALCVRKVTALGKCEISILTLRFVEKCPEDKESWARAAQRLNCESISQSCAESLKPPFRNQNYIFQYHCVINSYRNATMEVCALNRTILGFCAEFNIHGAVIQDNYDADCKQHTRPCPSSYNSAESYKYPSCYEMAQRNRKTGTETEEDKIHSSASSMTAIGLFLFTVCLLRRTMLF
ncbi:uncharacterized protein LOC134264307 [Saccostrea cucullata]|uniref:uncharacterized protein LOC134264307 n=1 Tax=Saccostrea cuccullata TaxID=36930 RepID=UPI002ED45B0C